MELYNDETLYSSSESGDVVLQFFLQFPSLLFLLLRAVLMNHSFDIVRLKKKKRNEKLYLFHADLKASGYSVSNKVKTNAKEKEKKLLKAITVNTTF